MVSRESPIPLVLVGGSAGAIRPLRTILAGLEPGLPAAVCVVIHTPDASSSALERVLAARSRVEVAFAQDGDVLQAGRVYVAPPGRHLLVEDGRLALSFGARENGARPAIDPLFRSAARADHPSLVSVVLSGTLDDGAEGTVAIRRAGGATIAQDPRDADFGDMPANAISTGSVAFVLAASEIAGRVAALLAAGVRRPRIAGAAAHADPGGGAAEAEPEPVPGEVMPPAADTVERGLQGSAVDLAGPPSPYACPDCGGVLYERGDPAGYLCRVGHRFSVSTLGHGQEQVIEDAMWTALRTLEEAASLAQRVRDRADARSDRSMARRFEERRASAQGRADRIRALLEGGLASPLGAEEPGEASA